MKNVVFVRWGQLFFDDAPVRDNSKFAYEALFTMGGERGLQFSWAVLDSLKDGKFYDYATFNGNQWERQTAPLKPHYIIDKSRFRYEYLDFKEELAKIATNLNPVELQILASDKLLTYLTFPEVVEKSILVRNKKEILSTLRILKSPYIVMKSPFGHGGKQVNILKRSECKNFQCKIPMIMQEFVDTRKGIPGLVRGINDIRLIFLGNKLIQSYIRSAAKGELRSNLTLGGKRIYVPLNKVPKILKEKSQIFTKRFSQFPNSLYSIDFVYKNGGSPRVLEINNNPTIETPNIYARELKHFTKLFIHHIEKFI